MGDLQQVAVRGDTCRPCFRPFTIGDDIWVHNLVGAHSGEEPGALVVAWRIFENWFYRKLQALTKAALISFPLTAITATVPKSSFHRSQFSSTSHLAHHWSHPTKAYSNPASPHPTFPHLHSSLQHIHPRFAEIQSPPRRVVAFLGPPPFHHNRPQKTHHDHRRPTNDLQRTCNILEQAHRITRTQPRLARFAYSDMKSCPGCKRTTALK